MAHRAQFHNSIFLFLFLVSCHSAAKEERIELPFFNADSSTLVLENRNGNIYRHNVPFTGKIYKLNANHDTLFSKGYYRGKEHGQWKYSYPNGQIEEIRYFDKGIKTKTLTRWWENGQIQLQCTFKNGEYEGVFREWNRDGQLTKEMNYQNGHENGSQKMYYDNGKIRSNYVIKNGKRIGLLGTKNCINVADSVFKK